MTTHEEVHRRALILSNPELHNELSPTRRLLLDRSYDVGAADTFDAIVERLGEAPTDLLVVDADAATRRAVLGGIATLPADQRPRHIAIFAEGSDDQLNALRRTVAPSHVSVLLRPLHLHRLLTVLRRIEGDAPQLAASV
jgi:hypothetical protein